MAVAGFLILGVLALTGLLLRMMGLPFDIVALVVVLMIMLGLAAVLVKMQIEENRTRRWLEKKWFPNQTPPPPPPKRWYQQRAYQASLGLLALIVLPMVWMSQRTAPEPVAVAAAPARQITLSADTLAPPPAATPTTAATASTAETPAPPPATRPAAAPPALSINLPTVGGAAGADPRTAVESAVQAWAQAWSAGDASAYLNHYSASFQPTGGQGRSTWERTRRERVTPGQGIHVAVEAMEFDIASDSARVRFVQRYTSKRLSDASRKQLDWVLENGQWKIRAETVLATLP
ncbi:MAG: hypothetical protein RLZZ352_415 [Pseudomonadota bacterium]|jgi:hypothetical protein